ncbi:hypothetical protein [Silanimonas sp.]|uniref:hypothetical protein n=1 Tax=Silanimonas sp. TaxID=1929290 RepID=UPI0022CBA183|nr:hypothetical protein [Silanimonas sp.]MCZ8164565.1 hypothetical protein [Silanimonas sp.]
MDPGDPTRLSHIGAPRNTSISPLVWCMRRAIAPEDLNLSAMAKSMGAAASDAISYAEAMSTEEGTSSIAEHAHPETRRTK